MRRRPRPRAEVSEALVRFDPRDWPASACHPECAYWQAVAQWQKEHPDATLHPEVWTAAPAGIFHPERI